jgi:aspartyl aminopeptidase
MRTKIKILEFEVRKGMEDRNAWKKYPQGEKREEVFAFAEEYRQFISANKTERECAAALYQKARMAGFADLDELVKNNGTVKSGDRIIADNMGKGLALFIMGKRPLEEGMNILGAHIDSPRLDLKQVPLYEDTEMALLDTHYYGGVKKYQWVTLPLALHGVVCKKDGSTVTVNIGDKPGDPVFGVSDLLIHLASEQMEKKASKVIDAENLDLLIGSIPAEKPQDEKEKQKDRVKANILEILSKEYGIEEDDFLSAEIEVVPAGEARDYGFDRSMIMGYGHDDRVCAYPSFAAMLQVEEPEYTSVCLLVDKEEIGSVGATGMQSRFFEDTVAEVLNLTGGYSELALRRALKNSKVLSSDVSAAFDPNFPSVMEKRNSAYFGGGLVFNKYTGSRGKSGSNDANAEYIARLRRIMDDNEVSFQTAELGKVDQGGGGTIAYILANYGMQVIDSGVAVLNMHAPWEIISKVDLYEALRGYVAFLKEA